MSYDQNNAGIHMVPKHENWNTDVNEKPDKYRMLNGESLVSKRAVYLSKGYIVSDEYRDGIPFVTKWCKMDPNKAEYLPGYLPICQCYDGPSLVHIYS